MSREVKGTLVKASFFFLVLEAMLAAAIYWWPSFAENVGSVMKIVQPVPFLRDAVQTAGQAGLSGYVALQHFFKGCNTLGVAAAILFAMGAIAGEAQRGTLELFLARPVTRKRLVTERFCAGYLALAVPIFVSSLTIPALLTMVDETMQMDDILRCSLHATLFLGAVYAATFFLSSLGHQPTQVALVMLFFTTFQFAIYLVKTITHYSLFRLADIETFVDIVKNHELNGAILGSLALTSVACFVGSLWAVERRVP